ncbi:hypothetical protein AgCh_037718 [Apium graveolens]
MMGIFKEGFVMVVIMVAIVGGSEGKGLCEMSVDDFKSCKPSFTPPKPVDPSAKCCEALSGANLSCFCYYRNSIMLPYFGIDPQLAIGKCNFTHTNTTNC